MQLTIQEFFPYVKNKLSIYRSDPEDNNKEHYHEFDEVIIVTGGRGFHVINDEPYFIKRGDVFFVNTGEHHFYDEIDDLRLINILVNPNLDFHYINTISSLLMKLQTKKEQEAYWLNDTCLSKVLTMIDEMFEVELSTKANEDLELLQESIFYRLIVFIITSQHKSCLDTHYKIHSLLKNIELNCYETVDWESISHDFAFSERTLYRHIKLVTGMTPDAFLRRLRLISARKLLQQSEQTITYIALKCGFSSSSHFSTCYRSIFGKTPSEERS